MGDAVKETKEKLETLKTAAEQANTALANGEISQEQYDALQREIVETENALKSLEEQANQSATAVQKIAGYGRKAEGCGWQNLLGWYSTPACDGWGNRPRNSGGQDGG